MNLTGKTGAAAFALLMGLGGAVSLSSCYRTQLIDGTTAATAKTGKSVAYEEAKRYFVRNDVETFGTFVIKDQAAFDAMFGAAAVMGKDGIPTKIDFSRQAVLAVTGAPVKENVEFQPVSVTDKDGKLTVAYRRKSNGELTYSITPCMLLVVKKSCVDNGVEWEVVK